MENYFKSDIIKMITALERVAESGDEFARGYVIAQVIAQLKLFIHE
jgi:hypothetical protein